MGYSRNINHCQQYRTSVWLTGITPRSRLMPIINYAQLVFFAYINIWVELSFTNTLLEEAGFVHVGWTVMLPFSHEILSLPNSTDFFFYCLISRVTVHFPLLFKKPNIDLRGM